MTAVILDLLSPFLPYIAAALGALVLFLTGGASRERLPRNQSRGLHGPRPN